MSIKFTKLIKFAALFCAERETVESQWRNKIRRATEFFGYNQNCSWEGSSVSSAPRSSRSNEIWPVLQNVTMSDNYQLVPCLRKERRNYSSFDGTSPTCQHHFWLIRCPSVHFCYRHKIQHKSKKQRTAFCFHFLLLGWKVPLTLRGTEPRTWHWRKKKLARSHKILVCMHKMLVCSHEILICGHEIQ